MILVVDRIEGNIVVCQDVDTEKNYQYDITKLPEEIKEGDVLAVEGDVVYVDLEQTRKRKDEIAEVMKNLFS